MSESITLLPKNTGIRGTRMLGFSVPEGAWVDGRHSILGRNGRAVPLGTRFVAMVQEVHYGFKRPGRHQYVVATTIACALALPLCRNPAWDRVMFLPLADPATGALVFTFFGTSERAKLIKQLFAATSQRAERGVYALPVVELAREKYRFSDIAPFITPEMSAQAAALCPPDMPEPGIDDMDLFDPALPIVAWVDLTPKESWK